MIALDPLNLNVSYRAFLRGAALWDHRFAQFLPGLTLRDHLCFDLRGFLRGAALWDHRFAQFLPGLTLRDHLCFDLRGRLCLDLTMRLDLTVVPWPLLLRASLPLLAAGTRALHALFHRPLARLLNAFLTSSPSIPAPPRSWHPGPPCPFPPTPCSPTQCFPPSQSIPATQPIPPTQLLSPPTPNKSHSPPPSGTPSSCPSQRGSTPPSRPPASASPTNDEVRVYGFDANQFWQSDTTHHDCNKVNGLTLPRTIRSSAFTSRLDIEGCDPLALPVAALLYQQADNFWRRKLAHGRELYLIPTGDIATVVFGTELLSQLRNRGIDMDRISQCKA
eukprot:s935_g44.t1